MGTVNLACKVALVDGMYRVTWADTQNAADRGQFDLYRTADGITWFCDGTERIAALPNRMLRFYRRGIATRCQRLLSRYLKGIVPVPQCSTVVNFGANVGEICLVMSDHGNRVLAIEPDPKVVPLLRANARGRSIEVIPVAAWNMDCQVRLYLDAENADTSIINPSDEQTVVPAKTIDSIVSDRGIDRVGLLIGDAEGAEPEVLDGAREMLRITDYVSVCASAERCGERTSEACAEILKSAGFDIIHRDETGFCTLIGRNANLMKQVT